ncbi:MAG: hypothetical protein Q4G40_10990, partial [Brachybacterium sp.]|nr:hypothetical protein [Brachybacterium sp.]
MSAPPRLRRIATVLFLPFLLLVAGCGKADIDFEILDAETVRVTADLAVDKEFADSMGLLTAGDDLCTLAEEDVSGDAPDDLTTEAYDTDTQYGCRVSGTSSTEDMGETFDLTVEGDRYHLVMEGDPGAGFSGLGGMGMGDPDITITYTFPGPVVSSATGRIDGNSVHFEG